MMLTYSRPEMDDMNYGLLGCPFCGGKAYATRAVNGTQMFYVGCAVCGVELKAAWYRDQDKPTKDLVALWNTRALLSAVPRPGEDDRPLRDLRRVHTRLGESAAPRPQEEK